MLPNQDQITKCLLDMKSSISQDWLENVVYHYCLEHKMVLN